MGEFSGTDGVETLVRSINRQLSETCFIYDIVVVEDDNVGDRFARIINELSQKHGKVVVVIDEYDNPLLNTIHKVELNEIIRLKLKGIYNVLKGSDAKLRFVFISGITKFGQINMFSGMNEPVDISMMEEYSNICGITQTELIEYFEPEIDLYAGQHGGRDEYLERLGDFYNGYCFTKHQKSVYNPFGILHHFNNNAEFTPYWSISGTPSFALKYLEMKEIDVVEIEEATMEAGLFADYRDDTILLYPLLYQAGYLTITDFDEESGLYRLNFPNVEVRKTFSEFLANNYSEVTSTMRNTISREFVKALTKGDLNKFFDLLKQYLHTVDYSLSSKITEYYFEFAVSNIMNMLGLHCINEAHTAAGRMVTVVFTRERIYIFEYKVDKPVEKAIWQMESRDYALLYANDGRKIVKVGIVFSRQLRNIVEWKVV